MDQSTWDACGDAESMLLFAGGRMSERKLRLFACACCRSIWHLLKDARCRQAVEVAEAFADGRVGPRALGVAHGEAWRVLARNNSRKLEEAAVCATEENAARAAVHAALWSAWALWRAYAPQEPHQVNWNPFVPAGARGECPMPTALERMCTALRDLVAPFQEVRVVPGWLAWQNGTVPTVARGIYADRDFARLPVLADALEDAGCAERVLLDHLRSAGPHFRGCWAVDSVLGLR